MENDFQKSKKLEQILNNFNNNYFECNPIGNLINDIENIGIKLTTDFPIQHLDYEKSSKIKLIVEDRNDILVNLYRMSSGRYEVNAYEIQLSNKPKKTNKINKSI